MKHTFTREQVKRIILEELARSTDEEEAEDLLKGLVGLKEDEVDEYEAKLKKAKVFQKRVGISLLGAVAILFGGMNALSDSQEQRVQKDVAKVQQIDNKTLEEFGVDTGALEDPEAAAEKRGRAYPTAKLGLADMSDMGNNEKIEAAWDEIDQMVKDGDLRYTRARIASQVPGGMAALDYDALPPNMVLPNSIGTKDQYRTWIVKNILKGDIKNLEQLRKFVFGNSGKWPSGSGNQRARYVGDAQVLPPEWTVAYDLLGDTTERASQQVADYYNRSEEETRARILVNFGHETAQQLEDELNDALFKVGRHKSLQVSLTKPTQ
jgi:hypothetical protein